ncbi:uncharacterized protein LTR77_004361 [Saxophila tyrrhenica]|uniref:F-box domain-containing protein n=1 Tax=Saxophila tyrrhenica TaxID=1690608 RepID=A0AAV9PFG4_9PEZI|nr:hypothetical protein LTR77_004361 [Saxophila tyrrhenica]
MDPLKELPAEIVLRILDVSPVSTVASLTRLNRSWHSFIDTTHQDAIYGSPSKIQRPSNSHDFAFLSKKQSFAKYFDATGSWKDLCKRQTLLARAWETGEPVTRESIVQVGEDAVWRFRPDFERRLIVSTSQQGGLNVTCMDSGSLLWRLSRDEVRPFAHLEYQDGTLVFDSEGNSLQVWKTGIEGLSRGEYRRVAVLPHDCQTRGFQLSYDTLCVVSIDGKGFVYDVMEDPPKLRTAITIEQEAVGHLDQNEDVVMFCMGKKGYHLYDKNTGAKMGIIDPKLNAFVCHILHPPSEGNDIIFTGNALDALPSAEPFPPGRPSRNRLTPIDVIGGPLVRDQNEEFLTLEDDEWGAALFSGPILVGISRGGRVMVCQDWRRCLKDPNEFAKLTTIIECEESDGSNWDMGGWLSIRNNRVMFEVQDRVYVVALLEDGNIDTIETKSYAFATSSAIQLAVPVSFMAIYDDCIMSTYTTLGWRRRETEVQGAGPQQPNRFRMFPTKTIRIVSLAPRLEDGQEQDTDEGRLVVPAAEADSHTNILQIMDMLSGDEDDD